MFTTDNLSIRILPQIITNATIYPFWITFIKAIRDNKAALIKEPDLGPAATDVETHPDAKTVLEQVIERCLDAAVALWDSVIAQPVPYNSYAYSHQATQVPKVTRIIELIELCVSTEHMTPCKKLFVLLLKSKGTSSEKFRSLYIPLIPALRELQLKKTIDLSAPPFIDLLQLFIGYYLRDVLGAKPRHMRTKIRKIGCNSTVCQACTDVDRFLEAPTSVEQTFRYPQQKRTHLEKRLLGASDLVTFRTIRTGSPHGLVVTKKPEIVAAVQWEHKQREARAFLTSIGEDGLIAKIMGSRYGDVGKALDGTQQFMMTVSDGAAIASGQPIASSSRHGQASGSSSSGTVPPIAKDAAASSSSSTVAGKKRKKAPSGVSLGPVIDLTLSD